MSIEEKRKELTVLIEDIKKQSDKFSEFKEVSEGELETMLLKATQLRDGILILNHMISEHKENAEEVLTDEEKDQVDEKDSDGEEITDNQLEEDIESEEEEVEVVEELIIQDVLVEEQEKHSELDEQEEKSVEPLVETEEELINFEAIELEEEISSKPDINETFSEDGDASLGDQLQKQPIGDLLTAIGINERYLYANELFDGNIEDFRKAIGVLNGFENREEAHDFFENELRNNYGWEDDNELATALSQLIERRFQL